MREGGVLSQPLREINVEALPLEVPEHIDLDVSHMAIGDTLRIADIDGAAKASRCSTIPRRSSRRVTAPTREVEPEEEVEGEEGEAAEGEEGEAAEGEAAEGEPEAEAAGDRAPPRARAHAALAAAQGSSLDLLVVGLGQPGPRVRAQPAQRRLPRRRRARAPARRLVALEVLRAARGDPARRPQGRAAEAGDVHERVGPRRSARRRASSSSSRSEVLVVHDEGDFDLGRLELKARRRPRRPQRAALDRAAPEDAGLPAAAHRRRPARARRPAPARRLRALRLRAARRRGDARRARRRRRRAARRRRHRAGAADRQPTVGEYHDPRRNHVFRPLSMDRPVLHAFVRELAEHERLGELAEALPTRARVSEAALPVVLACAARAARAAARLPPSGGRRRARRRRGGRVVPRGTIADAGPCSSVGIGGEAETAPLETLCRCAPRTTRRVDTVRRPSRRPRERAAVSQLARSRRRDDLPIAPRRPEAASLERVTPVRSNPAEPRFRRSSWTAGTARLRPRARGARAARRARRGAADACARLGGVAAGRARRAPRAARAAARLPAARGRRRARRRRGGRVVPRRRGRRLPARRAASAGSPASSRRRTSSASGRARSPCSRAAGSSARRRSRSPSGCRRRPRGLRRSSSRAGQRARRRRPLRGARARRLRARRARRRPRPVRGPRRPDRRLPDDRPRAVPHRVLRRRGRVDPRVLAVHAARAASGRGRARSIPPPSAASTSSRSWHGDEGELRPVPARPRAAARPRARLRLPARRRAPRLERGRARRRSRSRARPSSIRSRRASRSRSRRSGPRSRRAGSPRPRSSSRSSCAPASASSSRSRTAARRCARRGCCAASRRRILEPGDELPAKPASSSRSSPARRGFVWRELGLVLLPDHQVFRRRVPRERRLGGRALQSFADLRTGDYVVHEDHGVGKLLGFETKEVAGVTRDYLLLAFRGDDRLYVPHEQLGRVSRYVGSDAKSPALSKLGGKAWQLLKSRARESVHELASELIALYAQRQTHAGHRVRPEQRVAAAARGVVPVPRDARSGERDRGGQGGPRGARARWTGSSAATSASARRRSRFARRSRSR